EMLILRAPDVSLSRPVRLLHPRFPLYIVPRADHRFMIGATMIESQSGGSITARSIMELLSSACALHPAFGEAEVLETGVGVRPAFPDNLPRVETSGDTVR
ncbi:FAD-dependent oxidoreductase, partial [Mesorhizobium sp. M8A.F.Ca.ET.213.01.1.1]